MWHFMVCFYPLYFISKLIDSIVKCNEHFEVVTGEKFYKR